MDLEQTTDNLAFRHDVLGILARELPAPLRAKLPDGMPLDKAELESWQATLHAHGYLPGHRPDRRPRDRALFATKFSKGRVATLVAEETTQLHGRIGMTDELCLAHLVQRLVMIDHRLGDQGFHLNRYTELERGVAA